VQPRHAVGGGADHDLAQAVVRALDAALAPALPEEDQPLRVQLAEPRVEPRRAALGGRQQLRRDRLPGDRDQLEQRPRARVEPRQPGRQHAVERHALAVPRGRQCTWLSGQVLDRRRDQERVAARLGGQARGPRLGRQVGGLQQPARQRLGVGGREQPDVDVDHALVGDHAPLDPLELLQRRPRARPVAAVGRQHQQRRRVRRGQQLVEQAHAVDVGPVQVVDRQDHRSAQRQRVQQPLERGERPPPRLVLDARRVDGRRQPRRVHPRRLLHQGDALEHREQPRQLAGVRAEQRRHLLGRLRQQVIGERVDQAVERLERHRLVLVAAAREDHRVAAVGQVGEEPLPERRLARARHAAQVRAGRSPAGRLGERVLERGALAGPPDQPGLARRPGRPRHGLADRSGSPLRRVALRRDDAVAPGQHVRAGGPLGRVAAQQRGDQGGQRRVVGDHRRRRVVELLGQEHLRRRADVRQAAGQGLVQDHAERVPVARRGRELAGALLGRHVQRGAGVQRRLREARARDLRDQPEVEDDHAVARRDQHVRRLEVAVQQVVGVERLDRERQLADQPAHARRVAAPHSHGGAHVDALDEFHGDAPRRPVRHQLVERHQIGVTDPGHAAKLVLEAVQLRGAHPQQRLDGHARAVSPVDRLVDDAHAAGADLAEHRVRPEFAGQRGATAAARAAPPSIGSPVAIPSGDSASAVSPTAVLANCIANENFAGSSRPRCGGPSGGGAALGVDRSDMGRRTRLTREQVPVAGPSW
jgi:hypothetical protein